MRHLIIVVCGGFLALGCLSTSGEPGGSSSGGSSSGGGSTSTTTSTSTASSQAGSSASSTTHNSSASTAGSGGSSSSSNACGQDNCSPCPCGYASADNCLNGSWQCACARGSGSGTCGGSSRSSGNSSGGSSSSTCGPSNCPPCPPGCSALDNCGPKGWQCACACAGGGSSGGGGSGGPPTCSLDGGVASLVGSWSGTGSVTEVFGSTGSGGSGSDIEDVTDTDGGLDFQYFDAELVNCTLPWTPTGPTSANLVPQSSCADINNGSWTFTSGSASLDSTGCVLTEVTAGTIADPGGAGSFTTSSTLYLQ